MTSSAVTDVLAEIYRDDSRRVFATLVRLLGQFELAEDALHDAFAAASERWPAEGVPANPVAWLVSTGRFKAIDQIRRGKRTSAWDESAEAAARTVIDPPDAEPDVVEDDRLRLIFACCHPSLSEEARIALTLREVCGLATEEIARAFLLPPTALAQRIVRAKAKIRAARIPYEVPEAEHLPERLPSVLRVVYLLFNEGYSPSAGNLVVRPDLSTEAIRLARLLAELLPEPEVTGLLALLLLQESRRSARTDDRGDLVPLEEQDRSRWDRTLIAEGCELVERALRTRCFGGYTVQAAVAALHCGAATAMETDWAEIVGLYDLLERFEPTPVIALNRAVAMGMRDGPAAGLALIEELLLTESVAGYHLAHAAKAEFCRRQGRWAEARHAFEAALALTTQEPERRFLARRLTQLPS
jgi:RNA polymerase sigma-70 factor (ECF subfamily)